MINNGELKLYYLGNRDYVNGLTIFEESMNLVSSFLHLNPLSNALVEQFKLMKFIRTHAHLEFYYLKDIEQRSRLRYASAIVDLIVEDIAYRALLFSNTDEPTPINVPSYDRSNYVKNDVHYNDGRSEAVIHNVQDSYELLRGIIEVNQRFTVMHAPRMGIQESKFWGYMTGYRLLSSHNLPAEIEVNYCLKQVIPQNDRTMIVREVSVPIFGGNAGFDLCFFS